MLKSLAFAFATGIQYSHKRMNVSKYVRTYEQENIRHKLCSNKIKFSLCVIEHEPDFTEKFYVHI